MVDGCRSKLVNVVSGVPQGSVLSPPANLEAFFNSGCTLMAVVKSPGIRVTVAESRIRHLSSVSEWCDLCVTQLVSGVILCVTLRILDL